jgi:cytochrome c oxidase assembly protein subunit 11
MSRRTEQSNRRTVLKLTAVAFGMFAFGYALVPFYDVLCQATGLNGKTGRTEATVGGKVDENRWVTVEFTGNTMSGLPWEFGPEQKTVRVHPGEIAEIYYQARNAFQEDRVLLLQPTAIEARRTEKDAGTFRDQHGSAERG